MKTREIRELTTSEIQDRLQEERANLDRLVLSHSISPLDNPSLIRVTRRTIARMMTELRKRELNQQ